MTSVVRICTSWTPFSTPSYARVAFLYPASIHIFLFFIRLSTLFGQQVFFSYAYFYHTKSQYLFITHKTIIAFLIMCIVLQASYSFAPLLV